MAYGAVTVGTSPTLIVAANGQRLSVLITNTDSTNPIYIGNNTSVTTSNGLEIFAGGTLQEDSGGTKMYSGPIYGVAGTSVNVRYWERTR